MKSLLVRAIFVCGCIAIAACPANVWADRVDDLQQKVELLEQQLQELKGALQEAKETKEVEPAEGTKFVGPGGTFSAGGDIRWRWRYFENVWDFTDQADDGSDSFRFRPRVWLSWKPNDNSEAYIRFTKEWLMGQDEEMFGYEVEGKDAMFDNAWFQQNEIFGWPVDIKVGRQDLIYGEGFVLLDGTPQDGSQTISFDAAKATINHEWGASDIIAAKVHEGSSLFEDDESLYGLYNRWNIQGFGIEPYVLYRNKGQTMDDGFNPPNVFDISPKEDTVLLGFRGTKKFDFENDISLALAGEIGKEWGEIDFSGEAGVPAVYHFSRFQGQDKVDRDAWGATTNAVLSFNNVMWTPSIKGAFTYTSGDDPNTVDYEGWDDFYAQWPKFSELYVYSLYDGFKLVPGANTGDGDMGVWNNMMIPEVMLTVNPTDRWSQSFRYLYFMANEETGLGAGDERGHNFQLLSRYAFTKNLSGHLLAEMFDPGDYYVNSDEAYFVRMQLMYKF